MFVNLGGVRYETTPHNSFILNYDNDMLNCVFLDFGDTCFAIPKDWPDYDEIVPKLLSDGVHEVDCGEFDYEDAPDRWVFDSLAKLVISKAIMLCQEAADEA